MESILSAAPWYVTMLFYFSAITGAVVIAFGSWVLINEFILWVRHLIWVYQCKHRFNKPPLAKCYCKDCEEWHPHSPQATEGICWAHASWHTADNWFCWNAKPREKERK